MNIFQPAQLRQFLDSSFSGRTTALTELLQNCRRAGATNIDIRYEDDELTVTDNGCGITDLAHLLTPGTSGWDEKVMAEDKPFGLGFRAALLNCEHIEVRSKFGMFCCDTEFLLNGGQPEVQECDTDVTTITLVKPKIPKLDEALKRSARYFPIPVTYNGQQLNRSQLVLIADTDEYTLHAVRNGTRSGYVACLVQGLPVSMPSVATPHGNYGSAVYPFHTCKPQEYGYDANYVLELKKVEARVPDRESLPNPEDFQRMDLLQPLLDFIERNWDSDLLDVCQLIARDFSAAMDLLNEKGWYHDTRYDLSPEVRLNRDDSCYSSRTFWTRKGEPALNHLSVRYSGQDEEDMVALSWFDEADEGVDYIAATNYAKPVPQEYELRWHVSGKVEMTIPANGRLEIKLCSDLISIQPQYLDDDDNVVSNFPEMFVYEVFDAEEGILWISDKRDLQSSLYDLAMQLEVNLADEGESMNTFEDDDLNEWVADMTSLIEISRDPDGALMKLAAKGEQFLPSGVVRINEPWRGNCCFPLLDDDGNVVKEGVAAALARYPRLKAYLKEVLKDEQDDA